MGSLFFFSLPLFLDMLFPSNFYFFPLSLPSLRAAILRRRKNLSQIHNARDPDKQISNFPSGNPPKKETEAQNHFVLLAVLHYRIYRPLALVSIYISPPLK